MTGLAQVSGRNHLSWEEKFELDVEYVDQQSIGLDFKIMLKTVKVMVKKEGINAPDQAVGASRFSSNPAQESKSASRQ
jgi:lipopolysaccharide/colanic/teichoic acid biosynthesis glycosyltransferase